MADIISTSPDFNHYEASKPKIEVVSTVPENLDNKTKNILINTSKNVATILVSVDAKSQTNELKKEIEYSNSEKTLLKKIYTNSNNDEIKSSIEHKTIKIYEIEWTDKIAISLDWKNVDYIYNSNWTEYFDLKWIRINTNRYSSFKWLSWINEFEENNKIYINYEWKKYNVFSKEYFNILLDRIKFINSFSDTLMSIDFNKKD